MDIEYDIVGYEAEVDEKPDDVFGSAYVNGDCYVFERHKTLKDALHELEMWYDDEVEKTEDGWLVRGFCVEETVYNDNGDVEDITARYFIGDLREGR